jgi:hypothetical protein
MNEKLKNCPFCGSDEIDFMEHPDHCFMYKIANEIEDGRQVAWNTRYDEQHKEAV